MSQQHFDVEQKACCRDRYRFCLLFYFRTVSVGWGLGLNTFMKTLNSPHNVPKMVRMGTSVTLLQLSMRVRAVRLCLRLFYNPSNAVSCVVCAWSIASTLLWPQSTIDKYMYSSAYTSTQFWL